MESEPTSPAIPGFVSRLSGYVANSLRYWEPRRAIYNGVLALVVLTHFVLTLPGSWGKVSFDALLGLLFLAVLANVATAPRTLPISSSSSRAFMRHGGGVGSRC